MQRLLEGDVRTMTHTVAEKVVIACFWTVAAAESFKSWLRSLPLVHFDHWREHDHLSTATMLEPLGSC